MSKYQAGQTVQVFRHTPWTGHVVPIGAVCEVADSQIFEGKEYVSVHYNDETWAVLISDIVLHESSTNYKPEPRTYTEEEVKAIAKNAWRECATASTTILFGEEPKYKTFDSFWQANKPQ